MSAIKNLLADGHALIAQLEEREHELAAAFRAWFDKLTGNVPELKAEAKTDAETVAHDAETAAAPVVAEAEKDAKDVAGEVAADVTDAASATPAAAGTTP